MKRPAASSRIGRAGPFRGEFQKRWSWAPRIVTVPKALKEIPSIERPGAGQAPRFPVYEERPGHKRLKAPAKVVKIVLELLREGGQWTQRSLAERLAEDPSLIRLAPATRRRYVGQALAQLKREGRAAWLGHDAG